MFVFPPNYQNYFVKLLENLKNAGFKKKNLFLELQKKKFLFWTYIFYLIENVYIYL